MATLDLLQSREILAITIKNEESLKDLNHSFTVSTEFFMAGEKLSNIFSKSKTESIQSLNLTMLSPILAANSNVLVPHSSRTFSKILKAIFKGPAVRVLTTFKAENNPLKTLVNCLV